MIIYGAKATPSKLVQDVPGYKCEKCGKHDTTKMYFVARYGHLFWIPTFSMGRVGIAICSGCGHETKKKNMNIQLKENYELLKKKISIPAWHFTGIALIAVLMIFGSFTAAEKKKAEYSHLNSPMQGDVYVIESPENEDYFTAIRVFDVGMDTVTVRPNRYQISDKNGIKDIESPENYVAEEEFDIEKQTLLEKYSEGKILAVYRQE